MSKSNLKIAVAIPTFNREKTIINAIDSLKTQKYKNFDIHIFDNCSTDNSIKYIEPYLNNRIFLHKSDKNYGFVNNINRCLKLSDKYDWIGILHSDDIHIGESIQILANAAKKYPRVGFIFSEVNVINQYGKKIKSSKRSSDQLFDKGLNAIKRSLQHIPCSTTFYNSEAIKKIGVYDYGYPFSADEEYNNRISSKFDILSLSSPIGEHIIHENNLRIETWLDNDFISNYRDMRYKMLKNSNITESEIKNILDKQISLTCLDIASILSFNNFQPEAIKYNNLSWKYSALNFLNPVSLMRSILIFFPNVKNRIRRLSKKKY